MKVSFLLFVVVMLFVGTSAFAQCATGSSPSFSSSCTSQYFTSITASGSGVTSTVSYTGSSCVSDYYNLFSSQGVTAATGTTVNFNISRVSTYFAYLLIYVDWNNNGTFETSELAGSVVSMPAGMTSTTYSFTIPLIGIVTNTNLPLRVFLGEPPSSGGGLSTINPPCAARWGQANDYYIRATCTNPTLSVTPPSPMVCGTGTMALTANGAGSSPTYLWAPAAGLSATTGTTVTAGPSATTTYTVTGYGPGVCPATTPVTVTVNPGITPLITPGGATSFCLGGSVTLSETSGAGISYQWFVGASPIAGATNASYTASPSATTTYTVRITSSTGCQATASQTVTIIASPAATITPSGATTFCNGGSVTLSETSGTGSVYQWYIGASPITGATNSTYIAAPTATTNYSVRVTNASGCQGTASVTITILAVPTATITPASGTTVCYPSSSLLNANFATGYTYRWFNSGGVIGGAVLQYYAAGTTDAYRVEVTDPSGCSDTSAAVNITVNPRPTASATASGPLTFCSYDSITLTAATGYTYQWLNGTIVIAGATSISYTSRTPGTYNYRVVVTNGFGCSDTTAASLFHVVVNPAPVSAITASGSLTFCIGGTVTLSTVAVSGYTYQWYTGPTVASATPISGATTAAYVASTTGFYYVRVSTPAGCTTSSASAAVHVSTVTTPSIVHTAPLTFCEGGSVLLSLTVGSSSSGIVYQWKRNGVNIAGGTTATYIATTSGTYSCFVNMAGGCVGTTATVVVTVTPLPVPPILFVGGELRTSITYASYRWYRNGVVIPGATTYKITPHDTAFYSVVVTDANGCTSLMKTFHLYSLTLGINELLTANRPVIYPNPASDRIFVKYETAVAIMVSSVDGKTLLESPFAKEMDISSLPGGVYIVSLYDEAGTRILVEKLVK